MSACGACLGERALRVAIDERHRLFRKPRGEVALIIDPLLVAVQRMGIIGATGAFEFEVVVSAAAHELVTLVKAAAERVPFQFGIIFVQSQMPFSDRRAAIGLGEKCGEDREAGIESASTVAGSVDPHALLIAAEHQSGSCG